MFLEGPLLFGASRRGPGRLSFPNRLTGRAGRHSSPRWDDAELTVQAEEVEFHPGLGGLAALVAGDDDARDRDVLSRRGDPGQVALVRATRSETRHDLVVLGDDVLDREEQVRERIPIQGHFLSHTFRTGARIARIMIDVIRCDEMVCDGEVPLVPDLLEEPPLVGLVFGLFGHGAPSSQTTPLKTVARACAPPYTLASERANHLPDP